MLKTHIAEIILKKYGKKNPAAVRAGDTVKVHQRITEGEKQRIQIFEGLVIAVKHGNGLDGSFTVRKIAAGAIGVERTYPLHSPNVVKVERTKTASVSRAKLYYMRDRKGKNARFRGEVATPMSWVEPEAVIPEEVLEVVDMTEQEEVVMAIEEVAEAQEEQIVHEEEVAAEVEAEIVEEEAIAEAQKEEEIAA